MLLVAGCVCLVGFAAADERRTPVYTNEDLERLRPLREETGVASLPAVGAAEAPPGPRRSGGREAETQGEAYWRREAERVQDRVAALRHQIAEQERRLAERRRRPGVRPYSDPAVEAATARIATLRERIRDTEGRFEERARRAGARPGWLR